jgi:hypothetical protein
MPIIYWEPSDDAGTQGYEIESALNVAGPWAPLGSISDQPRTSANPWYIVGPPALFFYEDAPGDAASWYRIRAYSPANQASAWSDPFQAEQASSSLTTSELDVVRMALAQVGETGSIHSLAAPSTKAEAVGALFYPRVRDRLFSSYAWTWATRRQALAPSTETRSGWAYAYALPVDCLLPIDIDLGYRGSPGRTSYPLWSATFGAASARFSIEANGEGDGRLLLCDVAAPASLAYVARIEDPSLWELSFLDAVAWALAARLVMPLAIKPDLAQVAANGARQAFLEAVAVDANSVRLDREPESEVITARSW